MIFPTETLETVLEMFIVSGLTYQSLIICIINDIR